MTEAEVEKYCTESTTVVRATFVGPMEKGKEVMDFLYGDGWRMLRTGPYTDAKMHPKCDGSRFLFTAEHVLGTGGKS